MRSVHEVAPLSSASRFIAALAVSLAIAGGIVTPPAASAAGMPTCLPGDPVVWVNTSTKVYHMKGDQYYGNTKHGDYECKSAADKSGAHLSKQTNTAGSSSASKSSAAKATPKANGAMAPAAGAAGAAAGAGAAAPAMAPSPMASGKSKRSRKKPGASPTPMLAATPKPARTPKPMRTRKPKATPKPTAT